MNKESLGFTRLMMVIGSLSPLFLLWAIRGIEPVPNQLLWVVCGLLIILPNAFLYWRITTVKKQGDTKDFTVGASSDHREHFLIYLFAVLLPLYDVNIGREIRTVYAMLVALGFIVYLFYYLGLHYVNILFAVLGYRVYTLYPEEDDSIIQSFKPKVLWTRRSHLRRGEKIKTYRISDTVFLEIETRS